MTEINENNLKDKTFEKLRSGIFEVLWYASQSLENYHELEDALYSDNVKIKRFYHFLLFAEWAFYRCFINNIYNAIHKEYGTCNLQRFHNYLQSHPKHSKTFRKHIIELSDSLSTEGKYKNVICIIKTERDKVVSHNELVQYGFYPKIKYSEAKTYLESLISVFESISLEYDGQANTYDLGFLHAQHLLSYLGNSRYGG